MRFEIRKESSLSVERDRDGGDGGDGGDASVQTPAHIFAGLRAHLAQKDESEKHDSGQDCHREHLKQPEPKRQRYKQNRLVKAR